MMFFRWSRYLILPFLLILLVIFFILPKKDYVTDDKSVHCDWDKVNVVLEQASPEMYGLYAEEDYLYSEHMSNNILFTDNPPEEKAWKYGLYLRISYGAVFYEPENIRADAYTYFREPMIEIYLSNYSEGDFNYRAIYNLNGKLVAESGDWFLEKDKEEYCKYYLEAILKLIGKKSDYRKGILWHIQWNKL